MRKHGIIYLSGLFQDPIKNNFVAVLYVLGHHVHWAHVKAWLHHIWQVRSLGDCHCYCWTSVLKLKKQKHPGWIGDILWLMQQKTAFQVTGESYILVIFGFFWPVLSYSCSSDERKEEPIGFFALPFLVCTNRADLALSEWPTTVQGNRCNKHVRAHAHTSLCFYLCEDFFGHSPAPPPNPTVRTKNPTLSLSLTLKQTFNIDKPSQKSLTLLECNLVLNTDHVHTNMVTKCPLMLKFYYEPTLMFCESVDVCCMRVNLDLFYEIVILSL